MSQLFSSLPLSSSLLDGLHEQGFTHMTDIQTASLPAVLAGEDVLAQASTGSGKTLAFAIGLLHKLAVEQRYCQALVLCPTRELAEQVAEEIRKLAKRIANLKVLSLTGGTAVGPQIASLKHGCHIVVGTPGRIMDHVLKRRLDLSQVNSLVIDEADRMLDMGFADELAVIFQQLPSKRQTLLFSATYPQAVNSMSEQVQHAAKRVTVAATHNADKIQQVAFEVEEEHRQKALAALLTDYQPSSVLIFCNTRVETQNVADYLLESGFAAVALHGEMEQRSRSQVLARFANQSALILVATDVAARGLDIKGVDAVINYHVSADPEVHIHRIGRTGRAEATGLALTLCAPAEVTSLQRIEQLQGSKLQWRSIHSVRFHANRIVQPTYTTLCLDGGKKAKIRPGDVLGALTKDADIPGEDIGKIQVTATHTYVAVKLRSVKRAMGHFREGKIKGKKCRARKLL